VRTHWLAQVLTGHDYLIVDTKTISVVGYTRDKRHSASAGSATYGYCAARKLHYFGYKLVMVCTPDGMPVLYDLVPANTDERVAAETVLFALENATILGDKGFIGSDWQTILADETGTHLLTPKRANQHDQNPAGFDDWLNAHRERIESLFNQLQNTGRPLEHLLAKTVVGLATRIALKITALMLRRLLSIAFGFGVLAFSISH